MPLSAHVRRVPWLMPTAAADSARDGRLILVDVRSHPERSAAAVPGSLHVPYPELEQRLGEVPARAPVAFLCRTGRRSAHATTIALRCGREAYAVRGGLEAWGRAGLPSDRHAPTAWRDPRLEPTLAWSLRGSLLIVDVRAGHLFRHERIPGARNIPEPELEEYLGTLVRVDLDLAFVGEDDRAPARAVARLRSVGSPSWRIDGGMPAWRAAALPLRSD